MTVVFSDAFTGTGSINGRSADVGFSGVTWADEYAPVYLELTGTALACIAPATGDYGIAEYGHAGYGGLDHTPGVNEFYATLNIITGADVTPSSGRVLFNYTSFIGDRAFEVGVYESGGVWNMHLNNHSTVVVTVAASTAYSITLDVADTLQACAGFSQTLGDTWDYINPTGSQGLRILLGDETTLDGISATGVNNGHALVDAYAPAGTLAAYSGARFAKGAPVPVLAGYAGGTVRISPPPGQMSAISLARAYFAGAVSTPTLSSFGGGYALLAPRFPTLTFLTHDSYTDNSLLVAAPTGRLNSFGGATAVLSVPMQRLASTATSTAFAGSALTAPTPTLSATGLVSQTASIALTAPLARLVGYSGAVCSVTTGAGTLVAAGTNGGVGHVAVTVPMAELSAGATAQNYGSLIVAAPAGQMVTGLQAYLVAPMARLTAVGTATITATYEAYALNLHHAPGRPGEPVVDEMTRYTNFPFTHVVRYKNSYYGVASGALYLLEGVTDDTAPVAYDIKTAKTDFGTTEKKTILSAYFGGRLGAAETVTLVVGEAGTETYSYTTPRGPLAQSYRQVFGRGVKSRYFGLEVSGSDTFELDTIDLNVEQLTRRI